jgi:hypothetical protein
MPYDVTRDPFAALAASALSPARRLAAVVPSDSADLPRYGCLKVGAAGTIALVAADDADAAVQSWSAVAGEIVAVIVRRVLATGTTATGLLVLTN